MTRTRKIHSVVAGFLTMAVALPLAGFSAGALQSTVVAGLSPAQREALRNRDGVREATREYKRVMEVCRRRAKTNPDIICPDRNDDAAIKKFLRGEVSVMESDILHGAAMEEDKALTYDDLTDNQKTKLRRFQRVNNCPSTLQEYLPGFYELCIRFLSDTSRNKAVEGAATFTKRAESHQSSTSFNLDDLIEQAKGGRPDRQ